MSGLRAIYIVLLLILALMVVWLATPSSIFLRPVSMTMTGRMITSVRETPFGDVRADWRGEVTLLGRDGFECSGGGWSYVQAAERNLAQFEIGAWAWPCIDQGRPFVLRFEYRVLAFGIIPLRPVLVLVTEETK